MQTKLLAAAAALSWPLSALAVAADAPAQPRVRVSPDNTGFVLDPSGKPFVVWGFNYDHDRTGRLLEDYWEVEWPSVEEDFREMRRLGANVVRIHLQLGKFMEGPAKPNAQALDRLGKLLDLARREQLYLDLTGLGCYHKQDVPGWYDALSEKDRWDVQAQFWEAVAGRCAGSPAVFCYDLMNEPVVAGGKPRKAGDWLGGAFAGKYFVQFITLDPAGRPRSDMAVQWVRHLKAAIRKHDAKTLITVGLVDWSLDRPGMQSGFVPARVAPELDFVCVHLYPAKGKVNEALDTLKAFQVGKPVVIEETFPMKCPLPEFEQFLDGARQRAAGVVGFYWGETPEEVREGKTFREALMRDWLEIFVRRGKALPR